MMTVNQLIKTLEPLRQDAIVMLSCDAEGNYYSPLSNGMSITTKDVLDNKDVLYNEAFLKLKDDQPMIILYPMD